MLARVFEGYFDKGKFYNHEREEVTIPEKRRVNIMLFEESADQPTVVNPRFLREADPGKSALGLWEGEVTIPDDFNEPLDDLKEYMF